MLWQMRCVELMRIQQAKHSHSSFKSLRHTHQVRYRTKDMVPKWEKWCQIFWIPRRCRNWVWYSGIGAWLDLCGVGGTRLLRMLELRCTLRIARWLALGIIHPASSSESALFYPAGRVVCREYIKNALPSTGEPFAMNDRCTHQSPSNWSCQSKFKH